MGKDKQRKALYRKIKQTEVSRTLFLSLKQSGESEERQIVLRILYAVCDYLQYLYDQKDHLLKQEQHLKKKANSAWILFLRRRGRKWDV